MTFSVGLQNSATPISGSMLDLLRCPISKETLVQNGNNLISASGDHRYPIHGTGIPLFAESYISEEARVQQSHFDRIADAYIENLNYPHTQEYMGYLDRVLLEEVGVENLGTVAEICCGRGEAIRLIADRAECVVGLDVSVRMLEAAKADFPDSKYVFVQGDATRMPFAEQMFDNVFFLGGIHHVNNRLGLFAEVFRILKPGGRLIFREPLSDFILWKALRAVIYRVSPGLDHETERPLTYEETVPVLEKVGFRNNVWKSYGFLGFCLLMNSDILVFNRAFRFVPGIRSFTRAMCRFDDWITRNGSRRNWGLQVIGLAHKLAGN